MEIKITTNAKEMIDAFKQKRKEFENAVRDGIKDVDGPAEITQSYHESELRVRSGYLIGSFIEINSDTTKIVGSTVPYADIQNSGGMAGRGHKSHIRPTYYFTNGVNRIAKAIKDAILKRLKDKGY